MKKSNFIHFIALIFLSLLYSCEQKGSALNQKASITELGDLDENPLLLHAITTAVDLNKNQMSTLYANQKGADYALGSQTTNFPIGSRFYQVTWEQQEDSFWYGAYMPGEIVKIEQINFLKANQPSYRLYSSNLTLQKSTNDSLRIIQILSQPRAVSP